MTLRNHLLTFFDEEMLSPDLMIYWERAFTHPSVDPNQNYNSLKILGDTPLKYAFKMYLYRHLNSNDPHYLTSLSNHYMSAKYQPSMTVNLGLVKWIRIDEVEITDKILIDVLKAFVGALNIVATELYIKDSIKNLYPVEKIYKFTSTYFEKYPIDTLKDGKVPKNELLETWRFFANEKGNYPVKDARIILGDTFFRNLGKTPNGEKIVRDIKSLVFSDDEDEQIDLILEVLYRYNIDKEWRHDQILWRNFNSDPYIKEISEKNNIIKFTIEDLGQDGIKYYQLLVYYNDRGREKTKILKLFHSDKGLDIKNESLRIIRDLYKP